MGAIKRKLGLKGQTKPGEMISRMNKMKMEQMSCKTKGMKNKSVSAMVSDVGSYLKRGEQKIERGVRFAGEFGKAFVRNATSQDLPGILKHKTKGAKKIMKRIVKK